MKQLKDYLHLYLGCKCILVDGDGIDVHFILNYYNLNYYRNYVEDIKPILRPLSSITNQEAKEAYEIFDTFGSKACLFEAENDPFSLTDHDLWLGQPKYWLWLLSKHFDIFGLIEAGLAIDKTTLK